MSLAAILNTSILGTERSALPELLIREMVNSGAPQESGPEDRLLDAIILSGYRQKFAGQYPRWEEALPEVFPRPYDFSPKELILLQKLIHENHFVLLMRWLKQGLPFPDALVPEISSWYAYYHRHNNLDDILPYFPESVRWVLRTIPIPDSEKYRFRILTEEPDPLPLQAIAEKYLRMDDNGFVDVSLPEFEAEEKEILRSFSRQRFNNMRNIGFKSADDLYKFSANLPLQWWVENFGQDPDTLLEKNRLLNEEFMLKKTARSRDAIEKLKQGLRNELVVGWLHATIVQGDRKWAAAFFRYKRDQPNPKLKPDSDFLKKITTLISPEDRAAMLEEWIPQWRQKFARNMYWHLLTTGLEEWDEKFSRQVISFIKTLIIENAWSNWSDLVIKAGLYFPLSMYSELKYEWNDLINYTRSNWDRKKDEMMKVMWLRKQLNELSRKIKSQDE